MDLLARREHGRVELTRKLRQRGASDEMIEPALDRLPKKGC
jgi:regulatory protein